MNEFLAYMPYLPLVLMAWAVWDFGRDIPLLDANDNNVLR